VGCPDEAVTRSAEAVAETAPAGGAIWAVRLGHPTEGHALHLVSHYRAREPGRRLRTGGLSPSCAKRVVDYIRSHLDGTLSLEALAACAGYSPAHFSRAFRETFQVTPHAVVLDRRIERATELLARPDHSLLDVAPLTGFQTQQHFSRVFRQRIGISPGAFRHAG
jgi:AraC family transcriptional regulator